MSQVKKYTELSAQSSVTGNELVAIADPSTGDLKKVPLSTVMVAMEIAPTHAGISASTAKRLIYVTADELNNGDTSLYLHNGTLLKFLLTIA